MKNSRPFIASLILTVPLLACGGDDAEAATTDDPSTTGTVGTTTGHLPATTSTTGDPDSTETTGGSTESSGTDSETTSTSAQEPDESSDSTTSAVETPVVALETTLGEIVLQLDPVAAPITTENFLAYVESGFYDGTDDLGSTIFHRVVPGFVIQGGGLTDTLSGKATMPPIVNESGNGLSNVRGAIAMARTSDPDSARSQFFINVADNLGLDNPPGYAVFGAVIEGMEVVDAIVSVETSTVGNHQNVPIEPIYILSASVR